VIGGGDGYFGSNTFKTNKVQTYNIFANTYTYRNDFPIMCAMSGGGVYRDTIISVGGYTTGGVAVANCYKGVINRVTLNVTWTPMPSYPAGPITRMASYIAVKFNGVGLMCTGGLIGGNVPTAQTHIWNFCTQSWIAGLPDNTLARANYKACGRGDNVVYTVAGFTNTGTGVSEYITFTSIDGPCQNMVGINNNGNIPSEYKLRQNYPNPFNPSTIISYQIPEAGIVKLFIISAEGKELEILENHHKPAGIYHITFDGVNYPSGVYFCRLESGNFKETKKMLLIK